MRDSIQFCTDDFSNCRVAIFFSCRLQVVYTSREHWLLHSCKLWRRIWEENPQSPIARKLFAVSYLCGAILLERALQCLNSLGTCWMNLIYAMHLIYHIVYWESFCEMYTQYVLPVHIVISLVWSTLFDVVMTYWSIGASSTLSPVLQSANCSRWLLNCLMLDC